MYAIYGHIYHQYTPHVSIYTIHGSYGNVFRGCFFNGKMNGKSPWAMWGHLQPQLHPQVVGKKRYPVSPLPILDTLQTNTVLADVGWFVDNPTGSSCYCGWLRNPAAPSMLESL